MVYYKDRCFSLCFKKILSLQHKLLDRHELAWTFAPIIWIGQFGGLLDLSEKIREL